ncbi:hypothetical protein OG320_30700 [Microbispora sp. NBC_01189]|uniref:hypothetical protein n=1 Tax=unclassified Microbispora TaxID=2614687 RepID=UPI002E0DEA7F|nr:hypothetical protein OG320_30700 [Microbispora sp. NBC_01189]
MRHFFGLLLGVVVAAALLVGGGWASQEAVRGAVQNVDPVKDTRMLIALGVMVVVGLLLGLVLVTRVSPLSTFVPSMALLAWTVVYLLDVSRAASLVPTGPSVHAELLQASRGALTLLSTGVYALLGIALFLPVLMPSRWARPERDDEEEYEETLGY